MEDARRRLDSVALTHWSRAWLHVGLIVLVVLGSVRSGEASTTCQVTNQSVAESCIEGVVKRFVAEESFGASHEHSNQLWGVVGLIVALCALLLTVFAIWSSLHSRLSRNDFNAETTALRDAISVWKQQQERELREEGDRRSGELDARISGALARAREVFGEEVVRSKTLFPMLVYYTQSIRNQWMVAMIRSVGPEGKAGEFAEVLRSTLSIEASCIDLLRGKGASGRALMRIDTLIPGRVSESERHKSFHHPLNVFLYLLYRHGMLARESEGRLTRLVCGKYRFQSLEEWDQKMASEVGRLIAELNAEKNVLFTKWDIPPA